MKASKRGRHDSTFGGNLIGHTKNGRELSAHMFISTSEIKEKTVKLRKGKHILGRLNVNNSSGSALAKENRQTLGFTLF